MSMLKIVKKKSCKTFAIKYFFRIIVKGIIDLAQMVGYLGNQVYNFINQAMNRTFTKNLWSEASLQQCNHFLRHYRAASAGSVLCMTNC